MFLYALILKNMYVIFIELCMKRDPFVQIKGKQLLKSWNVHMIPLTEIKILKEAMLLKKTGTLFFYFSFTT